MIPGLLKSKGGCNAPRWGRCNWTVFGVRNSAALILTRLLKQTLTGLPTVWNCNPQLQVLENNPHFIFFFKEVLHFNLHHALGELFKTKVSWHAINQQGRKQSAECIPLSPARTREWLKKNILVKRIKKLDWGVIAHHDMTIN